MELPMYILKCRVRLSAERSRIYLRDIIRSSHDRTAIYRPNGTHDINFLYERYTL